MYSLTTLFVGQTREGNAIIGSGGKKVKSIIEETGVEAIDTQDDGIVRSKEGFYLYYVFFFWYFKSTI